MITIVMEQVQQAALFIIVIIGAAAAVVGAVWKSWGPGRQAIDAIEAAAELIQAQLTANGGSSLLDRVSRIDDRVASIEDRLVKGEDRFAAIEARLPESEAAG